jgi:hypothetical protein
MPVEVARRILMQRHRRHADRVHGGEIRAAVPGLARVVFDAERLDRFGDPADRIARRRLHGRGDLPDAIGAEVGLAAEHRVRDLLRMRFRVCLAAVETCFLVRERDDADAALRALGQFRDQMRGRGGDRDA